MKRVEYQCEHCEKMAPVGRRFCCSKCSVCEGGGKPCSDECRENNEHNLKVELAHAQ